MTTIRSLAALSLCLSLTTATSAALIPTTNLALWVRADQDVLEGPADPAEHNDDVTDWLDQSGNGHHLVHAPVMAGNFTQYLTNQVNSQPAVRFNDGFDRLRVTGNPVLTGTGDFSIFAVVNTRVGGASNVVAANFGLSNLMGLELLVQSHVPRIYVAGTSVIATGTVVPTGFYLLHAERVAGVVTLRLNNVVIASGTAAGSISGSLAWGVGAGGDYATSPLGLMAEQIVYTDSLTRAQRNDVLGYLEAKYDIGILPEPAGMTCLLAGGVAVIGRRRRRTRR